MTTSDLVVRLAEHFGPHLASDPSLVSESTSICTHYGVSPQELFWKWEAFAFNNKLPNSEPFTVDHARELRKVIAASHNAQLQQSLEAVNSSSTTNSAAAAAAGGENLTTPLKPSASFNRNNNDLMGTILGGLKTGTPIKAPSFMNNKQRESQNPFQTPSKPSHSSVSANTAANSPFSSSAALTTPGMTPATASAYRPKPSMASRMATDSNDVHMSDWIDSPSRAPPSSSSAGALSRQAPSTSSSSLSLSSFQIVESLNAELPLTGSGSQLCPPTPHGSKKPNSRVTLAMATNPKAWEYRYMFEKKGERAQVLDDKIDQFAAIFRSAYNLDQSEDFGDPSLPSQELIWVVGRICPLLPAKDSDLGQTLRTKYDSRKQQQQESTTETQGEEGEGEGEGGEYHIGLPKLSEVGVVLESSRMMGSGNRTPLTFNKGCNIRYTPSDVGTLGAATTLSLFPGQIVMCKGINLGVGKFSVSEICFLPPLPQAVHSVQDALTQSYKPSKHLVGNPVNIVAAAGPFTDPNDLEFRPWHRLMDQLEEGGLPLDSLSQDAEAADGITRRGVPDTLILLGPFISSQHASLPFSDKLPTEIFRMHFSTRLRSLTTRYPATQVVLIPSTLDILNVHAAYPQPAFSKEDANSSTGLDLPTKNVKCLPNPSTFYVNEVVVGTTTADALGDIKSEEFVTRIEALPPPNPTSSTSSNYSSSSSSSSSTVGQARTPTLPVDSIAMKNKDPNTRYVRTLLSQRNFYPLFPPPNPTICSYDTSHSHLLDFPAVTPDLLILPSAPKPAAKNATKPFIRVVNSTLVVQPSTIVTTNSSGSGAREGERQQSNGFLLSIHINPIPKDQLKKYEDQDQNINTDLWKRARVDIVSL